MTETRVVQDSADALARLIVRLNLQPPQQITNTAELLQWLSGEVYFLHLWNISIHSCYL